MSYLVALTLLLSAPALAGSCQDMKTGVQLTVKGFREYHAQNKVQTESLRATSTGCHKHGAAISHKISSLADALSCQAQLDAHKIDSAMHSLGGRCEGIFRKIHELQVTLRKRFARARADLDSAVAFNRASRRVQEACGSEVREIGGLVDDFEALGREIGVNEELAVDGRDNYGRFKDMAAGLRDQTKARNAGCGEILSALAAPALRGASKGQPAGVPAGRHARALSDVTGTLDHERLSHGRTYGKDAQTIASAASGGGNGAGGLSFKRGAPQAGEAGQVTGRGQGTQARPQAQNRAPASVSEAALASFSRPLGGKAEPSLDVGTDRAQALEELGLGEGSVSSPSSGSGEIASTQITEEERLGSPVAGQPGVGTGDLFARVRERHRRAWPGMSAAP